MKVVLIPVRVFIFFLIASLVFVVGRFFDTNTSKDYPKLLSRFGINAGMLGVKKAFADIPYGQGSYYGQGTYYSQGNYYGQGTYYSQGNYYGQGAYYSQGTYVSGYSQGSYGDGYGQSSYYSQSSYSGGGGEYGQGTYYSQGSYGYSQNGYYSQGTYGGGGGCSSGVGDTCCFSGDQLVMTAKGLVPISEITVGAAVVSYDENSDSFTTSRVGEVITHSKENNPNDFKACPLLEISVEVEGQYTKTKVTSNHPYFDPIAKTYKEVGSMQVGDKVYTKDGAAEITAIKTLIDGKGLFKKKYIDVYNLHMDQGPANYLVNGIVVHNTKLGH